MNTPEQPDQSLRDFGPKSPREYLALQLARRFNDLPNLTKYLLVAKAYTTRQMLTSVEQAQARHELKPAPMSELFFEILSEWKEGLQP